MAHRVIDNSNNSAWAAVALPAPITNPAQAAHDVELARHAAEVATDRAQRAAWSNHAQQTQAADAIAAARRADALSLLDGGDLATYLVQWDRLAAWDEILPLLPYLAGNCGEYHTQPADNKATRGRHFCSASPRAGATYDAPTDERSTANHVMKQIVHDMVDVRQIASKLESLAYGKGKTASGKHHRPNEAAADILTAYRTGRPLPVDFDDLLQQWREAALIMLKLGFLWYKPNITWERMGKDGKPETMRGRLFFAVGVNGASVLSRSMTGYMYAHREKVYTHCQYEDEEGVFHAITDRLAAAHRANLEKVKGSAEFRVFLAYIRKNGGKSAEELAATAKALVSLDTQRTIAAKLGVSENTISRRCASLRLLWLAYTNERRYEDFTPRKPYTIGQLGDNIDRFNWWEWRILHSAENIGKMA